MVLKKAAVAYPSPERQTMSVAAEKLSLTQVGGLAPGVVADRLFKWLAWLMAISVFVLIVLIGYELANGSNLALRKFGWRFLVNSDWDPVNEQFGALPFMFGTLVSSLIALIIAVP